MAGKVVKNTLVLSSANVLARAIGFFYFVFLGRILGVENFGHYNFALALVYNFYPVADFGVERLILRDISKDKNKAQEYFQKIIPLRLSLSLISIILVTFLGIILAKSGKDILNIFVFAFCLLPWTFNQLVAGIGNAHEKMEVQSIVAISSTGFTAILGGLIALFGGTVTQILVAAFFSNLFVSFFMFFYLKKLDLVFKIDLDVGFWKKILKESWVFALIMIMAVFYLRSSVVIVNYFKGAYFTGIYSSAFKFIEASILIPQSFALALFPQTARLLGSDKGKLTRNYLKSLAAIFAFAVIYALFFILFSPMIIKISYGPSYLEAAAVMRILSIAAIIFFLNTLPGNIIQNSNRVKKFLPFAFLNLILVIILCAILVPKYSVIGAAWAVIGGEVFGLIINNWFVFRILKGKND